MSKFQRDNGLTARMAVSFAVLTMLYLAFMSVLLYFGIGFIPIVIMVSLMILAQWYFSDKIVMWTSGAKVVNREQFPKLYGMVEKVALSNGLPMPKVAVMNTAVPNAFATGKSQKSSVVAVTTGIMDTLDDEELEGVIAHELAHIKHRDVLVLTLASLFSTVAFFLMRYALFGSMYGRGRDSGGGMILILVVAGITWFVSFLIIRAISRYREFAADRGGAQMTGKPENLARALLKISGTMKRLPERQLQKVESMNAFFIIPALSGDTLSKLFSTHPPVEERVRRLREMASVLR
ncbi:MAG TPA: zinc metalloprotease HtpX [Nitrososphaera sp.]|nr:zinc metalloprotease HtpX [Nitrososphaera sp.]